MLRSEIDKRKENTASLWPERFIDIETKSKRLYVFTALVKQTKRRKTQALFSFSFSFGYLLKYSRWKIMILCNYNSWYCMEFHLQDLIQELKQQIMILCTWTIFKAGLDMEEFLATPEFIHCTFWRVHVWILSTWSWLSPCSSIRSTLSISTVDHFAWFPIIPTFPIWKSWCKFSINVKINAFKDRNVGLVGGVVKGDGNGGW